MAWYVTHNVLREDRVHGAITRAVGHHVWEVELDEHGTVPRLPSAVLRDDDDADDGAIEGDDAETDGDDAAEPGPAPSTAPGVNQTFIIGHAEWTYNTGCMSMQWHASVLYCVCCVVCCVFCCCVCCVYM